MSLTILNHSNWSTAAITILATWVYRRANVGTAEHPYTMQMNCALPWQRGKHGTPSKDRSFACLSIGRRFRPRSGWPESYFYPGPDGALIKFSVLDRLEYLVHWLAIHVHCATAGHVSNFQFSTPEGRRLWVYSCLQAGHHALDDFNQDWPSLKTQIIPAMRHERCQARLKQAKEFMAQYRRSRNAAVLNIAEITQHIHVLQRKRRYLLARLKALSGPPQAASLP